VRPYLPSILLPRTVDAIRLDNLAPSRDFCNNYGASALVMVTRTYVTLNPYNVYTSQTPVCAGVCGTLPQKLESPVE
jgi:hypothetical protein